MNTKVFTGDSRPPRANLFYYMMHHILINHVIMYSSML